MRQAKLRRSACARVTAGLRCAPLTPPATHTAKATASPQPHAMISQSAWEANASLPRPDWLSAATTIATAPSPSEMMMNVPRNSATSSPSVDCCHRHRLVGLWGYANPPLLWICPK